MAAGALACSSNGGGGAGPARDSGVEMAEGGGVFDASLDGAAADGVAPLDASSADASGVDVIADAGPMYRDPLVQPFASDSIWNMPIGSAATYVAAGIAVATGTTLESDEDVIVQTPASPSTPIFRNTADWNPGVSRCPYDAGAQLFAAPMPSAFVVGDTPTSSTPNSGLAVLLGADLYEFSWRYQLPALITLPIAGALGATAVVRYVQARRGTGRPRAAAAAPPGELAVTGSEQVP